MIIKGPLEDVSIEKEDLERLRESSKELYRNKIKELFDRQTEGG